MPRYALAVNERSRFEFVMTASGRIRMIGPLGFLAQSGAQTINSMKCQNRVR